MPVWTEEQARAISARGSNLLLAAAAGSGKTTVMVGRVLALIEEGAGVDEMLIVTFTRASAADMRAKLTERLTELAGSGSAHSREQLARLESASISTIHSFCASLLRTYFEEAGVDPAFRVLDDAENAALEDAAVEEAMEAAYARMDEGLAKLDFGRGPKRVRELAVKLYHDIADRPDPDEWLDQALRMARGDGAEWFRSLEQAAKQYIRWAVACSEEAVRIALLPDGTAAYADALQQDIDALTGMLSLEYDALREALGAFKQVTPKTPRAKKNQPWPKAVLDLRERASELRKAAKEKHLKKAAQLLRYSRSDAMADIHEDAEGMEALFDLARDIARRHGARKAERNAMTFSDLEHKALALLRKDAVCEAVRARYRYVFVDEYQDTSDVQEELVSRVARADNRFMVGDVKQSIYRFRQAEPSLFLDCYRRYGAGEGGVLLALTANFRSRRSVLALTNAVFERAMYGGESEILYDEMARLNAGAKFEGEDPPVEIHLIAPREEDGDDPGADADEAQTEEEQLNAAEREAAVAVSRIRALKQADPKLRFGDIAVLTRTGRGVIPAVLTALLDAGIPAYADGSAGYFDTMEVRVFLAYLTLVENRRRDEAMIAVLRGPMWGLTSPELARIRAERSHCAFCDAVTAYARRDDALGETLRRFLNELESDRVLSRSMPLARLFTEIWQRTGFLDAVLAMPGGRQRRANLELLAAKAAQYEANQSGGLTGFLRYADRMKEKGDDEVAHIVGESEDVVRVMTVHKSKGLEFPVVIALGLGRAFRTEAGGDSLLTHRDLGIGMAHVDPALLTRRDTVAQLAIRRRKQAEDRAEELRVLYVLLTRAKERLILIGSSRSAGAAMTRWRVGEKEPSLYGSELDVIMPALLALPGGDEAVAPNGEAKQDGIGVVNLNGAEVRVRWIDPSEAKPVAPEEQTRRGDAVRALLEAAKGEFEPERRDDALAEAMAWRYPRERDVKQPIKLTASGLLRELEGPEVVPELVARPQFMTETGMTGAEQGTAVHAAMQNVDYAPLRALAGTDRAALEAELSRQLDFMRGRGMLTAAQRAVVPPGMLADFFEGDVGRRVLAAKTLHREWPFNLRMEADEALAESERGDYEGAMILVQGVIDLCFLEEGRWVLVDYKTDRGRDVEEIREHYRRQLSLYAEALERITGIPVKQRYLCLLRRNMTLELTPQK